MFEALQRFDQEFSGTHSQYSFSYYSLPLNNYVVPMTMYLNKQQSWISITIIIIIEFLFVKIFLSSSFVQDDYGDERETNLAAVIAGAAQWKGMKMVRVDNIEYKGCVFLLQHQHMDMHII